MIGDALTLATLVQQAPAMVLGAVALLLALWGVKQSRRADAALEGRLAGSAIRQGERLGKLDQAVQLLDMRRLITEEELVDLGVPLSYWPPDGRRAVPNRPRAAENTPDHRTAVDQADDDQADDDLRTEARRIPVPPLPPHEGIARHHRRSAVP